MSIRTLLIASVASAMAAIITSQFWTSGTPIAAAITPVIVALVSELLHRPTERIAQRFTTETPAPGETDALPEAAGAGPPPRAEEYAPRPAREAPATDPRRRTPGRPPPRGAPPRGTAPAPEYRVHRTGTPASRLPWKPILTTAAIAFAIAVAVLTLPELVTGRSLFAGDRDTTVFGGGGSRDDRNRPVEQETEPQQTEETQSEPEQPEPPEQTTPTPQPTTPEEDTPTTPPTPTAPAQPRTSPPAAPAPTQP